MKECWDFYQDLEGRWHWMGAVAGRTVRSKAHFLSRNDCIADAMRHGYLATAVPAVQTPGVGAKAVPLRGAAHQRRSRGTGTMGLQLPLGLDM